MAKIKQVMMRLDIKGVGVDRFGETLVIIHYDSTDLNTQQYNRPVPAERFYIKLPQVVADSLGSKEVRANDQHEVVKRFVKAIEKFKCLDTEVNKVIVYQFNLAPEPGHEIHLWDNGHKVSIAVGTFNETVMIAGDGSKRYSYEWVESEMNMGGKQATHLRDNGEREKSQVPWSEKNAAFFLWIKKNMELLIKSLYELEQPDKLIEMVHAGRLLPLGNQREGAAE